MLSKLGVAVCKEFVVAITNHDAIFQDAVDSSEQLVVGIVVESHDGPFVRFIAELDTEESVFVFAEFPDDAIGSINRRCVEVDCSRRDCCRPHHGTGFWDVLSCQADLLSEVEDIHGVVEALLRFQDLLEQPGGSRVLWVVSITVWSFVLRKQLFHPLSA